MASGFTGGLAEGLGGGLEIGIGKKVKKTGGSQVGSPLYVLESEKPECGCQP